MRRLFNAVDDVEVGTSGMDSFPINGYYNIIYAVLVIPDCKYLLIR